MKAILAGAEQQGICLQGSSSAARINPAADRTLEQAAVPGADFVNCLAARQDCMAVFIEALMVPRQAV